MGKETKFVFYFVFIGILCICISSIFGAIFYSETYFLYQSSLSSAAFESIYELFWNLGEISCYCLFVDRLKFSFKTTSHSISKINFILFRIAIIIYLLCALIFALYEFDTVSSSFNTTELFSWIYVFGIETIDFFIAFLLIFLFSKKLLNVTMDIKSSSSFFMDHLNDKNKKLLDVISKYCVLCITAIASTQCVNIYQLIIFLVIDRKMESNTNDTFNEVVIISVHRAFVSIDLLINAICLFLATAIAEKYYFACCGSAHSSIKRCCNKWSMSGRMKRRQNKEFQKALLEESSYFTI